MATFQPRPHSHTTQKYVGKNVPPPSPEDEEWRKIARGFFVFLAGGNWCAWGYSEGIVVKRRGDRSFHFDNFHIEVRSDIAAKVAYTPYLEYVDKGLICRVHYPGTDDHFVFLRMDVLMYADKHHSFCNARRIDLPPPRKSTYKIYEWVYAARKRKVLHFLYRGSSSLIRARSPCPDATACIVRFPERVGFYAIMREEDFNYYRGINRRNGRAFFGYGYYVATAKHREMKKWPMQKRKRVLAQQLLTTNGLGTSREKKRIYIVSVLKSLGLIGYLEAACREVGQQSFTEIQEQEKQP